MLFCYTYIVWGWVWIATAFTLHTCRQLEHEQKCICRSCFRWLYILGLSYTIPAYVMSPSSIRFVLRFLRAVISDLTRSLSTDWNAVLRSFILFFGESICCRLERSVCVLYLWEMAARQTEILALSIGNSTLLAVISRMTMASPDSVRRCHSWINQLFFSSPAFHLSVLHCAEPISRSTAPQSLTQHWRLRQQCPAHHHMDFMKDFVTIHSFRFNKLAALWTRGTKMQGWKTWERRSYGKPYRKNNVLWMTFLTNKTSAC